MENENKEEYSKEYDLFRVLLFYIIIGFLGWIIFYFIFTSSWFDIKKVNIHGNYYLDSEAILTQIELIEPVNIFHFDIDRATKKLSYNPWVQDSAIKKIYPKQLDIKIIERKPGALLYSNDLYYLVTVEGTILTVFQQFNNDFKQFIITGLGINSNKPGEMIKELAYKEAQKIIYGLDSLFAGQFYKIEVISQEEYLLFHTNNQIKVRIENGEQLINEWYLLDSALQKIAAEQIPLQEINMKYKERLLIILKD